MTHVPIVPLIFQLVAKPRRYPLQSMPSYRLEWGFNLELPSSECMHTARYHISTPCNPVTAFSASSTERSSIFHAPPSKVDKCCMSKYNIRGWPEHKVLVCEPVLSKTNGYLWGSQKASVIIPQSQTRLKHHMTRAVIRPTNALSTNR